MINATDYGVAANWNGNDATATDDTVALRAAIAAAATSVPSGMFDQGGCAGNAVLLPKGTLLISDKIVIPSYVRLIGCGQTATVLKMSDAFDPTLGFIDCGDATTHVAAFACGLQDLYLYSRNTNAVSNRPMVYTNNAQDYPVLQRCKIVAGNGTCIWAEIGYGGASYVAFTDLEINNNGAHGGQNLSPQIITNYGETLVSFSNISSGGPGDGSGGPNACGIWVANGITHINGFHAESIAHAITVAHQNSSSLTDIQHVTGGANCTEVVRIMSPTVAGAVTLRHVSPNGAAHTVNAFGVLTSGNIVAEHLY